MRRIELAFWGALGLIGAAWLFTDPLAQWPQEFFALRRSMLQLSGVLAIACMSLAMLLALRPRWPERWLGGLDKMYRLHKWFGIAGLVLAITHWLWAEAPKWAVGFGWLTRPHRGPPATVSGLEQMLRGWRDAAEGLGEWAFYAAVLLIVIALVPRIPYHHFFKTHRLLAVAYLVLVFHSIVLLHFASWATPHGALTLLLLAGGAWAAVVVLLRRVGHGRRVAGTVVRLHDYPALRVIEGDIDVPRGWPGHAAGQFAFVTNEKETDGAHPYTIASAWNADEHRLTFIAKALGDHTRRLRETLAVGQAVTIEGPYGCFTFDDEQPRQIWIGGGIGITPFIARMKQLASARAAGRPSAQVVDLFHTTTDYSEEAIGKLTADAAAAGVRLHVLHDARDGLLTTERVLAAVPEWREASVWFCGPAGFGSAVRRDLARHGFAVDARFHQELFAMR